MSLASDSDLSLVEAHISDASKSVADLTSTLAEMEMEVSRAETSVVAEESTSQECAKKNKKHRKKKNKNLGIDQQQQQQQQQPPRSETSSEINARHATLKEQLRAKLHARIAGERSARMPKSSKSKSRDDDQGSDLSDDDAGKRPKHSGGKRGKATETKEMSLDEMFLSLGLEDDSDGKAVVRGMIQDGKIKSMKDLQEALMVLIKAKHTRDSTWSQSQSHELQDAVTKEIMSTSGAPPSTAVKHMAVASC